MKQVKTIIVTSLDLFQLFLSFLPILTVFTFGAGIILAAFELGHVPKFKVDIEQDEVIPDFHLISIVVLILTFYSVFLWLLIFALKIFWFKGSFRIYKISSIIFFSGIVLFWVLNFTFPDQIAWFYD